MPNLVEVKEKLESYDLGLKIRKTEPLPDPRTNVRLVDVGTPGLFGSVDPQHIRVDHSGHSFARRRRWGACPASRNRAAGPRLRSMNSCEVAGPVGLFEVQGSTGELRYDPRKTHHRCRARVL